MHDLENPNITHAFRICRSNPSRGVTLLLLVAYWERSGKSELPPELSGHEL